MWVLEMSLAKRKLSDFRVFSGCFKVSVGSKYDDVVEDALFRYCSKTQVTGQERAKYR